MLTRMKSINITSDSFMAMQNTLFLFLKNLSALKFLTSVKHKKYGNIKKNSKHFKKALES